MRSLKLFDSFSSDPAFRSRVTARTQTFHEVTESGTVNSIEAEPLASVRRCGIQKAVSAKLPRNSTGAAGAAASALAGAALSAASPAGAPATIPDSAATVTASFSARLPDGPGIPGRRPGPP